MDAAVQRVGSKVNLSDIINLVTLNSPLNTIPAFGIEISDGGSSKNAGNGADRARWSR